MLSRYLLLAQKYLGEQRDFKVYLANKMLRRAVEREFEIIGEAMSRIEKLDPSIAGEKVDGYLV